MFSLFLYHQEDRRDLNKRRDATLQQKEGDHESREHAERTKAHERVSLEASEVICSFLGSYSCCSFHHLRHVLLRPEKRTRL